MTTFAYAYSEARLRHLLAVRYYGPYTGDGRRRRGVNSGDTRRRQGFGAARPEEVCSNQTPESLTPIEAFRGVERPMLSARHARH